MSDKKINYTKILRGGDNAPTDKKLWAEAKEAAKKKFDVYPSAVANAWASKYYADKGGGWKAMADGGRVFDQETAAPMMKEMYLKRKRMADGGVSTEDMELEERKRFEKAPLTEVPETRPVSKGGGEGGGGGMEEMLGKILPLFNMADGGEVDYGPDVMLTPEAMKLARIRHKLGNLVTVDNEAIRVKKSAPVDYDKIEADLKSIFPKKAEGMADGGIPGFEKPGFMDLLGTLIGIPLADGGSVGSLASIASAIEGGDSSLFPSPINVDDQVNKATINVQKPTVPMAKGGYVVSRSNERKGKTHKVTGPDGSIKFFGDPNLKNKPDDPQAKSAWYARHAKSLKDNPHFRAYAKSTWAEGGYVPVENFADGGGADTEEDLPLPPLPDDTLDTAPVATTSTGTPNVVAAPGAVVIAAAPQPQSIVSEPAPLQEVASYLQGLNVSQGSRDAALKSLGEGKDTAGKAKDLKTLKNEAAGFIIRETDDAAALLGKVTRPEGRPEGTATSGTGALARLMKTVGTQEKFKEVQGVTPRGESPGSAYQRVLAEMVSRSNIDALSPEERDLVRADLERKAMDIVLAETRVKPRAVAPIDVAAGAAQAAQDRLPAAQKGDVVVPAGSPMAAATDLFRELTGAEVTPSGVAQAPVTPTVMTPSGIAAPSAEAQSKLSEPLKTAIEKARSKAVERGASTVEDGVEMQGEETGPLAATSFSKYEDILEDSRIKYSPDVVAELRASGDFLAFRKAAADAGQSTKVPKGELLSPADRVAVDEVVRNLRQPRLPTIPTGAEALQLARETPEGRMAREAAATAEKAAALSSALDVEAGIRTREIKQASDDLKAMRDEDFLSRKAVVDAQIDAVKRGVVNGSLRVERLISTDPLAGKKLALTLGAIANGFGDPVDIEGMIRRRAKAQVDAELSSLGRQETLLSKLVAAGNDLKDSYALAETTFAAGLAASLERSLGDITDARAKTAGATAIAKINMENAKKVTDLLKDQVDIFYKPYEKALQGAELDIKGTTDLLKAGMTFESQKAGRAVDMYRARTDRMGQELKAEEFKLKKAEMEDPVFMAVLGGAPLRPDELRGFMARHPTWKDQTARRLVALDRNGNVVETDNNNPRSFDRVAAFRYEPGYLLARSGESAKEYAKLSQDVQKGMEFVGELENVYREAGGSFATAISDPKFRARTDQAVTFLRGLLTTPAFLNTGVPSGQERTDLTAAAPSLDLMKSGDYTVEQLDTFRRIFGRSAGRLEDAYLFSGRAGAGMEPPPPAAAGDTVRVEMNGQIYTVPKANEAEAVRRGGKVVP